MAVADQVTVELAAVDRYSAEFGKYQTQLKSIGTEHKNLESISTRRFEHAGARVMTHQMAEMAGVMGTLKPIFPIVHSGFFLLERYASSMIAPLGIIIALAAPMTLLFRDNAEAAQKAAEKTKAFTDALIEQGRAGKKLSEDSRELLKIRLASAALDEQTTSRAVARAREHESAIGSKLIVERQTAEAIKANVAELSDEQIAYQNNSAVIRMYRGELEKAHTATLAAKVAHEESAAALIKIREAMGMIPTEEVATKTREMAEKMNEAMADVDRKMKIHFSSIKEAGIARAQERFATELKLIKEAEKFNKEHTKNQINAEKLRAKTETAIQIDAKREQRKFFEETYKAEFELAKGTTRALGALVADAATNQMGIGKRLMVTMIGYAVEYLERKLELIAIEAAASLDLAKLAAVAAGFIALEAIKAIIMAKAAAEGSTEAAENAASATKDSFNAVEDTIKDTKKMAGEADITATAAAPASELEVPLSPELAGRPVTPMATQNYYTITLTPQVSITALDPASVSDAMLRQLVAKFGVYLRESAALGQLSLS